MPVNWPADGIVNVPITTSRGFIDLACKWGKLRSQGLSHNPAGHNIKAVIKACSMEGIADMCHEEIFTFMP